LTVEKQDGQRVEYNPERLKGVNVYKELDREFATGDRLQFTAPDKKLGVANRDLATIEAITPATAAQASQITVKMDAGHSITFDPQTMRNFDHGYAVTSHSSQGQTADRVLIHVDTELGAKDLLNSRMAYVAVSRGARDAQIFTNNSSALGQELSRDVSHSPAIQQAPVSHAIEQPVEQRPAHEHEIGQGFGMGM
jgi:ATP-dependent exoDNAse (exonuclease V) alpha subunit